MTSFPINYEYDSRNGIFFDGMAETAEDARVVMSAIFTEANGEPTESSLPSLATTEAGITCKTRGEIEKMWADEIAAGYVTPLRVWGGWVAQVEYWEA